MPPSVSDLLRANDIHVNLLHYCWLFLTDVGQSLLNPAREFVLPGDLDLGVFLSHPDGAVTGDFRGLDARSAYLLAPGDVRAPE